MKIRTAILLCLLVLGATSPVTPQSQTATNQSQTAANPANLPQRDGSHDSDFWGLFLM